MPTRLLVTDIDNTLFDWVRYYTKSLTAMLEVVEKHIGVPVATLKSQAKEVFAAHDSIEYPFLIQELPAVMDYFGEDIDGMLTQLVRPAREVFRDEAVRQLVLYESVEDCLRILAEEHADLPIVALTDAPRYVAMWKLNKLGVLHRFSAIYGLADPKIPTDAKLHRVKVEAHILLKHLQQSQFGFAGAVRILPNEYEKPGSRGLRTVLMDYDDVPSKEVLWVGDNFRKDVGLGVRLGVRTAWASYGARVDAKDMEDLHTFSPEQNIAKHANIQPDQHDSLKPDYTLKNFSEILEAVT
jgi:FMN phosphatase YigB (HAD superfamily)